jgi:hypothetical protein
MLIEVNCLGIPVPTVHKDQSEAKFHSQSLGKAEI